MSQYPIDLGKSMKDSMTTMPPAMPEKKEKYYPSLYLDWDDDYELPEDGILEIRFHKKSETNRNSEGKTSQSVELEIREILDVESEEKEAEEEKGGEALDRYRKESK